MPNRTNGEEGARKIWIHDNGIDETIIPVFDSLEEWQKHQEERQPVWESDAWLDEIESELRSLIEPFKQAAEQAEDRRVQTIFEGEVGEIVLNPDDPSSEALHELVKALQDVDTLRHELVSGNVRKAALAATSLGWHHARSVARHSSKNLKRGMNNLKTVRKAHEAAHGTREEKEFRWAQLRMEYDRLSDERPNLSKLRRRQLVAQKFGVSESTVKRRIRES